MDKALEEKSVFPARFFSAWSYHTEMITGGWAGCVCVRWNRSRLKSIISMGFSLAAFGCCGLFRRGGARREDVFSAQHALGESRGAQRDAGDAARDAERRAAQQSVRAPQHDADDDQSIDDQPVFVGETQRLGQGGQVHATT